MTHKKSKYKKDVFSGFSLQNEQSAYKCILTMLHLCVIMIFHNGQPSQYKIRAKFDEISLFSSQID